MFNWIRSIAEAGRRLAEALDGLAATAREIDSTARRQCGLDAAPTTVEALPPAVSPEAIEASEEPEPQPARRKRAG